MAKTESDVPKTSAALNRCAMLIHSAGAISCRVQPGQLEVAIDH
jgi:hypothetical protein